MLRIEYTKHAINQMRERNISTKFIEETVSFPDKTIAQSIRSRAIKTFKKKNKNYLCIVIYEDIAGIKKIITAFFTTSP